MKTWSVRPQFSGLIHRVHVLHPQPGGLETREVHALLRCNEPVEITTPDDAYGVALTVEQTDWPNRRTVLYLSEVEA